MIALGVEITSINSTYATFLVEVEVTIVSALRRTKAETRL